MNKPCLILHTQDVGLVTMIGDNRRCEAAKKEIKILVAKTVSASLLFVHIFIYYDDMMEIPLLILLFALFIF